MNGTPVPDSDHVARYCKPSSVDEDLPVLTAFLLREGEEYISVNWLEHFGMQGLNAAVGHVRAAFLGACRNSRRSRGLRL